MVTWTVLFSAFFCSAGHTHPTPAFPHTIYRHASASTSCTAFRRTVSLDSVFRAYTVVVLSMLMVMLGCFLLVILEPEMKPMDVLFEGFSAFGTAGLSRGITEDLSKPSQAILMVLMFAGRIGSLALAFSLARPRA